MTDIEKWADVSEKALNKAGSVFSWLYAPKEEARNHLINMINEHKSLTPKEKASLMYNSRKLAREYGNAKAVYEQAKERFNAKDENSAIDDDWLHFFFDKAEKTSSKSMQILWARMLAGEFNKPGSISRKLMHIISVMDASSAKSFQTLCCYIFKPRKLFNYAYNTDVVLLPSGFYTDSFDFMRKVETWLSEAGFTDYKQLAMDLTMNNGELNSLENLGLLQRVPERTTGTTLMYYPKEGSVVHFVPQNEAVFQLGQYCLTWEGEQLAQVINGLGKEAVVKIVEQYLLSLGTMFKMEEYIGKKQG